MTLTGLLLGLSLPHHPRFPAPLQHQVEALQQVFYLIAGRIPELLVAE
jgi:hypothetical protein